MSQILAPPKPEGTDAAPVELLRRPITVDEFYRMAEVGILRKDERIELIEGEMIPMSPIGDLHSWFLMEFIRLAGLLLGGKHPVSVKGPLRLTATTYVEPDFMIGGQFPSSHAVSVPVPGPRDIQLLVEVSPTTLAYGRNKKLPLYTRAGIREVWIVDVAAARLWVHRDPSPDGYLSVVAYDRAARVAASALPEFEFELAEIFK